MKKKRYNGKSRGSKPQYSSRQREVESADMKEHIPNRFKALDDDKTDRHSGGPNDWRWYAANPQLIRDFASFPFGAPVGNQLNTGDPACDVYAIPGLYSIEFIPSIGVATGETSPINVAMRRLFSLVRRANSGATNYEAPDLMMYMLAVDSALMFLSFMKRAYAVMLDYTPYNRYYPISLVTAMGIDFDDLQKHLNDFRGYINIYAAKIAQLWIPNTMSYMARHTWMCEGIYTDSESQKAQTYMYTPVGFYQFAIDATTKVGKLNLIKLNTGSTPLTVDQLVSFGDSLIAPMITNQDFGIMAGDILKAFGEAGIVKVYGITEGYQILPTYNKEVLSQIENSRCFGNTWTEADVTQATAVGTGYLQCTPSFSLTFGIGSGGPGSIGTLKAAIADNVAADYILNFHGSEPTPEEVMVATRLMARFNNLVASVDGANATLQADLASSGSEVVVGYKMWQYMYQASGTKLLNTAMYTWNSAPISLIGSNITLAKTQLLGKLRALALLSNFDWHPPMYQYLTIYNSDDVDVSSASRPFQDIDFYTLISESNIMNLDTTALLSELSVPMLG